ncbi:MAG: membrane protein insertion efficiency factor YidD [Betaproteobacteria bacterium]|nr:membrane protein insertion efficiency factor YidD [Betaproteobacteria bacterium]
MLNSAARAAIKGYQLLLSPYFGQRCRFWPSCSSYALEAIERHGLIKGGAYSVRRLARCHPFHPGGIDPVPGTSSENR